MSFSSLFWVSNPVSTIVELTPVWIVWFAGAEDVFSEERWDEREPIKIWLETTQASTDEWRGTTLTNSLTVNQQLFILIHINNISQHDALSGLNKNTLKAYAPTISVWVHVIGCVRILISTLTNGVGWSESQWEVMGRGWWSSQRKLKMNPSAENLESCCDLQN